jgi:hypothetical protein
MEVYFPVFSMTLITRSFSITARFSPTCQGTFSEHSANIQ